MKSLRLKGRKLGTSEVDLGEEIVRAISKAIKESPIGEWRRYSLTLEFEGFHETGDEIRLTNVVLKPKSTDQAKKTDTMEQARTLECSTDGASFMEALKAMPDPSDRDVS
jgi:hypothetical protein